MLGKWLEKYALERLRNHNQGGIPINILIDLEHYKTDRLFLQMTNWYDIGLILVKQDGSTVTIEGKRIDKELSGIIPSNKSIREGMVFIPEFRTLLIFTPDFDKRLMDYTMNKNYSNLKPLTSKDWVYTLLRMNISSIINKTSLYRTHYLKTGKAKGFSKTEMEFIKDAYLPIYIKADLTLLFPNPIDSEKFILHNLEKASTTLDNLISKEIGKYIILSDKVYYGGYKSFVDGTQSYTLYVPKIKLIEKGYPTPIEFVMHLYKTINQMDDNEFNELFHTSTQISSYNVEASKEVTVIDDLLQQA